MTEEYEKRAIDAFVCWYRETQPTIEKASQQALTIAKGTIGDLDPEDVLKLIQENVEWVYMKQHPFDICKSDGDNRYGINLGELVCRHFVRHLERVIQQRGLQAVYAEGK